MENTVDQETQRKEGPSKFEVWADSKRNSWSDTEEVDEVARQGWNACCEEAIKLARDERVSDIQTTLDLLIGRLVQLKAVKKQSER